MSTLLGYQRVALLAAILLITACSEKNNPGDLIASSSEKMRSEEAEPLGRIKPVRGGMNDGALGEVIGPVLAIRVESDDPKLARLGIPTTTQARFYRSMTDETLERLAADGDLMASTFLVERLASRTHSLQQRRGTGHLPASEEGALVTNVSQMHRQISQIVRTETNAMAGYLYGQMISASTGGVPPEAILAGIRLSGDRGDPRAAEFERQFRSQHPELDQDRIDMYYEYGRQRFNMGPPKE